VEPDGSAISKYNGQKNDDAVEVDFYVSTGLVEPPSWKCRQSADTPLDTAYTSHHASWIRINPWTVASRSIDPSSHPPGDELPNARVRDAQAFVRGGYLVARLPDKSEFWHDGENTTVAGYRVLMSSPVLLAGLSRGPDGSWSIDDAGHGHRRRHRHGG
jgi:hypothetical protein